MADGKDSQSKQFGDTFITKLGGQLDKKAPVFNKSLFVGAGQGTRNAWDAGTDFANGLNGSAGFGTGQRGAMDSLGGVFSGYGQLGDNNGLTGGQSDAMAGNAALGGQYGALGQAYDPNSSAYKTLRGNIADDTLTGVGSLFASNGRYGSDIMGESAAEGLGNALAGLDYGNMQNNINNQYRSLDSQRGIFGDTFSMGQQGVGNQFNALGGQAGVAGQQFGMGQQALGNQMGALDRLTGIGGAQDANRQGQRLGNADLFDRRHNAELDRLLKIGAGFGDPVGAANQPNWWQSGLGALLGFGGSALSGGLFGGGS
jgi:hypothetical protein